jgi:hypothetical protein
MDIPCNRYDPKKGICTLSLCACNHIHHFTCSFERTGPVKKKKEKKKK